MLETSARLLRLLGVLQSRPSTSGPELAARLGVTTRTVRADVERLRTLGYPVEARRGRLGGYRLGLGTNLPPLLLDDDEAVAIVVGLRAAAVGGVEGIEESSLRALTKLEQVLPSRLRHRVAALHEATLAVASSGSRVPAAVAIDVLEAIATTMRLHEGLRFELTSDDGSVSRRSVHPHRLVHTRGAWHLVAWDPDDGWCLFPVARITPRTPNGPRFHPREDPPEGVAAYVETALGRAPWHYRAVVRVLAPAADVAARVPPAVTVQPLDEGTCQVHVGSDDPHQLALWLTLIDAELEVDDPELRAALGEVAARLGRAAAARQPGADGASPMSGGSGVAWSG